MLRNIVIRAARRNAALAFNWWQMHHPVFELGDRVDTAVRNALLFIATGRSIRGAATVAEGKIQEATKASEWQ